MKLSLANLSILSLLTLLPACTTMQNTLSTDNSFEVKSDATTDFQLIQGWNNESNPSFADCNVDFTWQADALIVTAHLTDADVHSKSSNDNQKMWELGDVFEMFIQIEGQEDYFELHITPTNTRFQAHKPNVVGTIEPGGTYMPIEHWLVSPVQFKATATQTPDGWIATMEIPPSLLGYQQFETGQQLRINFARYDGGPGREPDISASANHQTPSFHQPDDWHRITLVR
jgi:hypothetical protein